MTDLTSRIWLRISPSTKKKMKMEKTNNWFRFWHSFPSISGNKMIFFNQKFTTGDGVKVSLQLWRKIKNLTFRIKHLVYTYRTPPLQEGYDTWSIFKRNKADYDLRLFLFSRPCFTKTKEISLPNYLPIADRRNTFTEKISAKWNVNDLFPDWISSYRSNFLTQWPLRYACLLLYIHIYVYIYKVSKDVNLYRGWPKDSLFNT